MTNASATKQKKRETYQSGGVWMKKFKVRWDAIAILVGVGGSIMGMTWWFMMEATGGF